MSYIRKPSRPFNGKDTSSTVLNGNNKVSEEKASKCISVARPKNNSNNRPKQKPTLKLCKHCNKRLYSHHRFMEMLDLYWFNKAMFPSENDGINFWNRKKSYKKYLSLSKDNDVPICIEARIKIHFSHEHTIFKDGSHIEKWFKIVGKVKGGKIDCTP